MFHPSLAASRGRVGGRAASTWVRWRWGRLRGLLPCPCRTTTPRSATSTAWTRVTLSTSAAGTCRRTWGRTSTWWSRRRGSPRSCRVQYVAASSFKVSSYTQAFTVDESLTALWKPERQTLPSHNRDWNTQFFSSVYVKVISYALLCH